MKGEKIFWGIFFILAGVFLVIGQLGMLASVGTFKIICTIFLVAIIIKSIPKLNFTGILFPLAFICILFDKQLGLTDITPWTVLGAALLGSIGFSILFHKHYHKMWHDRMSHKKTDFEEGFERVENGEDGNNIYCKSNFGSTIKYVNSDDFQYANLESSFGAMKVYFDNAIIQKGNATIELQVSFGGVELFIPKEWNVICQSSVSFGAIEEKNKNSSTGSPTVTLTGEVSFAGVTIIYI